MKPLIALIFAACLPLAGWATETIAADGADTEMIAPDAMMEDEALPEGLLAYDAIDVDLDEFLWLKRPIVVLANTPADPNFERQIRYIEERAEEMLERDVVLIVDTDPAAGSAVRQRLRPRGFMLAIIDKDGEIKQRRPSPRSGREILQTIDKFPSRREEFLEQRPAGRN